MARLFTLVTAAIFAALAGSSTAARKDACVLVDFTTKPTASEFDSLNSAIGLVKSANVLGSLLKKYDPLVLRNVKLAGFNYSILGQHLTFVPTIETMNITGLRTVVPEHVNVTSSNTVDISAYSTGHVSVEASLGITTNLLDASAKVQLTFSMKKPTFAANVEANMFACAPDVSTSLCSNMTVADLQVEVVKAAVFGNFKSILKKVLVKFKGAAVKSTSIDFDSVSEFDLSFDSSNFILSSISGLLADYSAKSINNRGTVYKTVISAINGQAPGVLNHLIKTKLKPMFGATCLSEE
ncbi:Serine/threonine protein Kinase [Phytophthora cinnamomi]|uniref:Serine/threonine protein Kinase n=1 Tax=Phytophthora cinnamomi TaxID=4785 RepID=UPI00355A9729|nr:Serine/threonine protein Kinase [Phytophthora cinnamomi]